MACGKLIRNGSIHKLLVVRQSPQDRSGYEETLGFIHMHGMPSFSLQGDGMIGSSFAGKEIELDYDEVAHYECGSAARNNPILSENIISYFAGRGDT